jgi:hypothetical protein
LELTRKPKLSSSARPEKRAQLHFQAPGVEAQIVEVSMTEPDKFIVRTRGQSPLKKGDVIVVDIRS